jgi:hypothetical protein
VSRLWSWIKDTIAYQGEYAPVPIELERTPDGHGYQFRLGVRAGFGGQDLARLPIHHRPNQAPHPVLKEIFSCRVAGRTLEAANLFALRSKVASAIETIAPARILPLAYFRVEQMDYDMAVYEDDGQIVAPVLSGPKLKARDLAGIRRAVCRYLVNAGYAEEASDVVVEVLRPRDLRLVAPAAVIRSQADEAMWLPTVEGLSAEGPVIGVLASAARLSEPERPRAGSGPLRQDAPPADSDVISLLRLLRAEMQPGREPVAMTALYASEVRPEIWEAVEARTSDAGTRLVAHLTDDEHTRLELGIRRTPAGDVCAAFADTGINAFLADDEEQLAEMVGRHLHASGFLRFMQEIEIHAAEAERPAALSPDEILTTEPEEVHS